MRRPCVINGCDKPRQGRGYCPTHYSRWRRYGATTLPTPLQRLLSKVIVGDCWEFTGTSAGKGYGQVRVDGKNRYTHRYVWEQLVGPIEDGLQIDHRCRNKRCCNPDHLETVTAQENTRRKR